MKNKEQIMLGIVLVVALLTAFNSYQLSNLAVAVDTPSLATTQLSLTAPSTDAIPTGVPKIYGAELGVSLDDVSPADPGKADLTIRKLAQLDKGIELEGKDLERYVNILFKMENGMSCEYCCGAQSIIFESGKAACGCAHSFAMRGITKYLITQHGSEYSDTEILAETGKWKARFFPTQIQAKADILKQKGIEADIVALTSNKYRGIEKGSGGGMVGGC